MGRMLALYSDGAGLRLFGGENSLGEIKTAWGHHVLDQRSHAVGELREPFVEILPVLLGLLPVLLGLLPLLVGLLPLLVGLLAVLLRLLLHFQKLPVGSRVAGPNFGDVLVNCRHNEICLLDEFGQR